GLDDHHNQLLASCLAQSEALMRGKTHGEAVAELQAATVPAAAIAALAPHNVIPGNRPSSTLPYPLLDPYMPGRLIATYDHKVIPMGAIWGINSFDQWGVELGKQLAASLVDAVAAGTAPADRDGSTAGLVGAIAAMRARN